LRAGGNRAEQAQPSSLVPLLCTGDTCRVFSPKVTVVPFSFFYFQIGRAKEGKRKRVENKEDISRQKTKCERGSER
jgi:hypothetical protein